MTDFWDEHGKTFLTFSIIAFIVLLAAIYIWRRQARTPDIEQSAVAMPSAAAPKDSKDSTGERECRRVIEKLMSAPFPKCRPPFLANDVTSTEANMYRLELDCFNPELGVAVEYNGRQHYEYVPFFHKNREAFYNQKYRDELKRIKCREHNVLLIEVPYSVPVRAIEAYISDALAAAGKVSGKK